jgi:hypothetical protein
MAGYWDDLKKAEWDVTKAMSEVERLTQQRIAYEMHGLTRRARLVAGHLLKARGRLMSAHAGLERARQRHSVTSQ